MFSPAVTGSDQNGEDATMATIDVGATHILSLMHMEQVEDPERGPALEMDSERRWSTRTGASTVG